jgi:exosome complex exonuclease RRP6
MASSVNSVVESNASDETATFAGFKDVDEFSKAVLKATMNAVRCCNELPSAGDDFDYFSSFASFQQFVSFQKTRLLQLVQSVMRYHGARGSLSANSEQMDIDDRFDVLVDANDQLLERVGTLLDEAMGLRKKETSLVVVTKTPKLPASGGWNKKTTPSSASRSGYRLLTSRHVTRPQINFKDKIDNSSRPFRPKITVKPNACQPLSESMKCDVPEDVDIDCSFVYPHPYQYELMNYTPEEQHLEKADLQPPLPLESTPLTLIVTECELKNLCETLKNEREFAVDLEHHSYRSYQGITCLIQISTRSNDYIIDALALREHLHLLNDSFTDPKILKVFHGADQDVLWLQRDFGVYVVGLFDTHQASRLLGFARHRLLDLLRHYCSVETNKELQLEDWRIRPLPAEFLLYARMDTHYLLYIFDCMKNDLRHRCSDRSNLLLSVFERSAQICTRKYQKFHVTDDSYKDLLISHRKLFNPQQIEALRGIYMWRDRVARQEDESTGYVLPNLMMLQMAELLPRDPEGILACCTHIPPLVQQHLSELHHIIKEARDRPTPKKDAVKSSASGAVATTAMPHAPRLNYCPHDFSHPQAVISSPTDDAIEVSVEVCDKPVLSAFAVDVATKTNSSTAKQLAAEVYASFTNPFAMYLPAVGEQLMDEAETSSTSKSIWKLLPHTSRPAAVTNRKQVEVLATAPVIMFNPSPSTLTTRPVVSDGTDTTPATTVRQQLAVEKVKPAASDDSPCTSLLKKKKRKPETVTSDAGPVEFVPHDYGKVSLDKLLAEAKSASSVKKKKKKREFDANLVIAESDFKSVARPKSLNHSAPKSMTYTVGGNVGKSQNTPKILWPKR